MEASDYFPLYPGTSSKTRGERAELAFDPQMTARAFPLGPSRITLDAVMKFRASRRR
jgi:hypothetical protein